MQSTLFPRLVLLAAAFGSADALAQVDSFSLNFEKIRYEYRNSHTGGVPFALDIVVGDAGEVSLRPYSTHNLTFKRGQFYPADPLPATWLGFDLERSRGGRSGELSILIDQSDAGTGGGPQVKVFDGTRSAGASVHTGGVQVLLGDGSVRFVRDSLDVTLRGEPAAMFNRPGPGEPLEAYLPVPQSGQTLSLTLRVMDDRGARTEIPVQIQRSR
jgi:hypothetical protein